MSCCHTARRRRCITPFVSLVSTGWFSLLLLFFLSLISIVDHFQLKKVNSFYVFFVSLFPFPPRFATEIPSERD